MPVRTESSSAPALVVLFVVIFVCRELAPANAQLMDTLGPGALVVSPDGHRIFVTGRGNRSIYVIDAATDQNSAVLPLHVGNAASLGRPSVTADGSLLYIPVDQEPPTGGTLQLLSGWTDECLHSAGTSVSMGRGGLS
jgi:YVTN family beta-propeller protein